MKRISKIILISAALVTVSGVAIAGRGFNCDVQGPYAYGAERAQQMQGQFGPGKGMRGGPGRGGVIYQLDNLSDAQKQQISELRQQHQAQKFAMREQMAQSRADMKKQIDALLTEAQRQQLSELAPWH